MPERNGHCGLLEAAIHVAQCTVRFFVDGACRARGSVFLGLHAEHTAASGSVDPARDDTAAGFIWLYDAAAG